MTDGMNYAPLAREARVVCEPGEFRFAVAYMDHGHIFGMATNLAQAGATCTMIYEPDAKKAAQMAKLFPQAKVARSFDEVLQDASIHLVIAAAVPNLRGPIGIAVMQHGKDYFTDKTPFTTLDQLEQAQQVCVQTHRKYAVCYSERLQNESAEYAAELIRDGVIGEVVQVLGIGPHRLSKSSRPAWFFDKARYGGILCDIGSHQAEQYLTYTGAASAVVTMARVGNHANPDVPGLEDFGEFSLLGANGTSGYFRMDWFTPDGLRTWGDGRTTILGTRGFIECRKYIDLARDPAAENNVYVVTETGEEYHNVTGRIGFPFFPEFILDCLERTERSMTQRHCFLAAELCLRAQALADRQRHPDSERIDID